MAKVTFIPNKPQKGRVQLSTDELQVLRDHLQKYMVFEVKHEKFEPTLAHIYVKVSRAYNRLTA